MMSKRQPPNHEFKPVSASLNISRSQKAMGLTIFFFSRKEAKALVLLRRSWFGTQNSAKPTQGSGGVPPAKLFVKPLSSFPEKQKR
jgi:hypothetical protein